jgi:hypothetical protein
MRVKRLQINLKADMGLFSWAGVQEIPGNHKRAEEQNIGA